MEDLEGRATAMAWDWDMDDIDTDEDKGKQWVPVMPQTMKQAETPRPTIKGAPMLLVTPMPPRKMSMYTLHPT